MNVIEVISYGPEVKSLLASGRGRVLAVVSNAVYLECYKGYVVSVVGEKTVSGPLSLRVRGLPVLLDTIRDGQGVVFQAREGLIDIGGLAIISLRGSRVWTPRLPERLGEVTDRNCATVVLAEAIADYTTHRTSGAGYDFGPGALVHVCQSSLASASGMEIERSNYHLRFFAALEMTLERWPPDLGGSIAANLTLRRLAEGILRFAEEMEQGRPGSVGQALTRLIGVGAGLTPAGDDLVSGIVASMVWQARPAAIERDLLASVVGGLREVGHLTNRISARLLHYATEGILYAPAMELGAALLAGERACVNKPARQLFAIGHSSGVDLAVGLLVGCLVGERGQTEGPRMRAF